MRIAKLIRTKSSDQGTFGMFTAGSLRCFSGELPWRLNQQQVSCIPAGTYEAVWAYSPRLHKYTYRLKAVPNREGILIHSANLFGDRSLGWKAQLLGCISLGEQLGTIDKQQAILLSRPAVRRLEDGMDGEPFKLEVRDA